MPAIEPTYGCDFPGCTNVFPQNQGFSFFVYAQQISIAPIASFSVPDNGTQTIACSINHANALATTALATLVTEIETKCAALTPPFVPVVVAPNGQ